ncbi:MAG: group II intron reverse transcriptase/maturase [Microcystis sp. M122S2]|uniref:group II intron reverse transcriptase/maturase n=1 Tax=Microcystis sp. M122S2 TaxID=2771142 RepID=UPI00258B9B7C|nr:group II intron reverse transcriptase/maturase [Microcystis sp. M122S2]MCA2773576.1 group II intron reverse transcriptase/maturase [Microcystis sp. M122S2]
MDKTKPFNISKALVYEAYQLVKVNNGAAGVDKESIAQFEENLSGNLYKLWNRLTSGSYFPPAVKGVAIPKKQPGEYRLLGVPTVSDRIAQMSVKLAFEPLIEPYFLADSYGYRPNKSALDAIGITRQRCWRYDYVLEFDIRGLFDNIDWELLMKAVKKHTDNKWILLYIKRWLQAPMQMPDGSIIKRTKGTPQGGVISPVLANLFLHYVFDTWMTRNHSQNPWARYADDGICHCRTKEEAQALLDELSKRFTECKLELHPEKTKIIYCGTGNITHEHRKFTFLGYDFRRRSSRNRHGQIFTGFGPGVSAKATLAMIDKIRKSGIKNRPYLSIKTIAYMFNPIINGWINYYGKYTRSGLYKMIRYFNCTLVNYLAKKYKFYKRNKDNAVNLLIRIRKHHPNLFAHWRSGMEGAFV